MRIVLIGPPGSGKGTQGPLLAGRLGVPRVVVGDLLREAVAAGGELGERLQAYLDRGELVPDHLVQGIVERALRPHTDGFVLDGFPRTVAQVRALDRFLHTQAAPVDVALWFRVPNEVLVGRLAARGRADDSPEIVSARLAQHERDEAGILEHYRGRIVELDAEGSIDEVHDRVLDGLHEARLALAG